MGTPFIINIDCSSVLCNTKECSYIMFVDDSKMTLVYELIEWIRWVFSLKDCIFLTHENSVIHELEDIQVLSKLKYLKIKPCGQAHCIHKQFYRTLLNNLNFYVNWNDMRVPKYFAEKLSHVKQKLPDCINSENNSSFSPKAKKPKVSNCLIGIQLPNITTASKKQFEKPIDVETNDNIFNVENNFFEEENYVGKYCKIARNSESLKSKVKQKDEKFFNINLEGDKNLILGANGNEFYSNLDENSMETENLSFGPNHKGIVDLSNGVKYSPRKELGETKLISEKDKKSNNDRKSRKCVKPFSLAETLINLREEFKDIESNKAVNSYTSMDSAKDLSDEDQLFNNNALDFYNTQNSKGKKRRRRRQRKKYSFNSEIIITKPLDDESLNECKKTSNNLVKPNHIRFNIDDDFAKEMSEIEGNSNENKLEISRKSKEGNLEDIKSNKEEILSLINHKKQILTASNLVNSDNGNYGNKMNSLTPIPHTFTELESFPGSNQTTPSKESEYNSLNILMQLKQKFPSPVVIERY